MNASIEYWRPIIFVSSLVLLLLLEYGWPRRADFWPLHQRKLVNIALLVVATLFTRLLLPVAAVGVAVLVEKNQWGLLQQFDLSLWLAVTIAFISLDFAIYWQHRLMHRIPLLWRMHRVHHADVAIDVTTALRFHPLEIALSMLFKMALVVLIGAPVLAVVLFEIVLSSAAMFNHANLRLYADRWIRNIIVTPDMHRVHHSVIMKETNSNYGFFLSIWDRLFGSYIAQPQQGHDEMTIGLEEFRREQGLLAVLLNPFRNNTKTTQTTKQED